MHISLTQSCRKFIKIPSLSSISEILLISPNYRLLFPSSADDMIKDVRSLFAYIASAENEPSFILYFKGLSVDTSRIVVMGVSGGNYPARAAATLSNTVPRPIGWLDLFGMGSDWLLDFWINGVDVERTMPVDTTLHDMAKQMN